MNIEERNTNTFDIIDLTANLRKADRLEVETITGTTSIYNKLKDSILKSSFAKSFLVDGKVAGVYGVSQSPHNNHIGYPYLLCTNELYKIKKTFIKNCIDRVGEMQSKFPVLFNYIDSRNILHINWIKYCGFKIINDKYFNNVKFYGFMKKREDF